MFKQLIDLAKRHLFMARELDQCKVQIEVLQTQVQELIRGMERLAYEIQRTRENEAHEREKTMLRLEVALLRFERRLPPARRDEDAEER